MNPRTTTLRLTAEQRQMVEDNIGLAGWAVNRWARHLPNDPDANGYTQADAKQDAVFGLAAAARGYDPAKGWAFSTYANLKMRRAISRGIGDYYGIDYRIAARHSGTAPIPVLGSLDAPLPNTGSDTPGTLADALVDPRDQDAEIAARITCHEITARRHLICETALDAAMFDLFTDLDDHRSSTAKWTEAGNANGCTPEAARQRWLKLRQRISASLSDIAE